MHLQNVPIDYLQWLIEALLVPLGSEHGLDLFDECACITVEKHLDIDWLQKLLVVLRIEQLHQVVNHPFLLSIFAV